ncbi:MAG TPA: hypothetical protein VHW23_34665 [Kofleriaceae bacterium]|nr:hypothetical protein [Kofleriaceae bacterium]
MFLIGIAAAVSAAASTARADSIKPMAPTWCGSYKADPYDTMYKYLDEYSKNGFTDRFMVTLAKAACDKPSDAGRQRAIADWRDKFNAYYRLTEAENRELLEVSLAGTLGPAATKVCNNLHEAIGRANNNSALRAVLTAARKMLDCNAALDESIAWWVDDGTEIDDPIVKTAWIDREMWPINADPNNPDAPAAIVGIAAGHHDAASVATIDRNQVLAELEKLGVTGPMRLKALMFLGTVQTETPRRLATYEEKARSNPNLKKVLFDVPDAAWDEWVKDATTWKAALDDERAVETEARQGKLGACGDKMRKHLAAYVDAKKPTSKKAVIDVLTDPIGYRLSLAAMLCDSAANDMTQFAIQHMLQAAKLRRGPRVHMYYALLGLGDTVPGFDPKYMGNLDDKALRELLYIPHLGDVTWAERTGIIGGLSPKKDGVLVTFKTSRWTEAVWNCVTTNRIDHFENGRAVYYQDCHPTGKTKGMSSTEKPVLISKNHAQDLKVGQFVTFDADARNSPAVGGPTFGYTKSDQKKLVSIFGIKL